MPSIGRTAAAVLSCAIWFAPVPAQAQEPPAAISALALSAVTRSGPPEFRTTTLLCAPQQTGSHPDPVGACTELSAAQGDFAALTGEPAACPMIYEPVSLLVVGVWDGRPVSYQREFANSCVLANAARHVYKF
ncbi:SSI family serine proteinase inhibitor [Nocardia sp. NPDC024068]|uniref:SSI family serine proteinase inhibitor n=1 Tax=Nocardia sp. NPDC024068 TaxID=3157197 RepID=UPI0033C34AF2